MSILQVFDPAMCCSTGVCGPSVDPVLPRFSADLEWLKSKGVQVERYNLAQDIAAFTANAIVKAAINSKGTECLPMVLVDGSVVSEGAYPTREQVAGFTGVAYEPGPVFKQHVSDLVGIGLGKSGTK
ncbi:MAG TPA: arsenite efflux transporter metallochaperone ArsD [Candidatus Saccharimonadales bacterium]|nr:arsenite efflux transporter metallochaperone ArsD [Candidatus Saccharimonadales bacterium]